jgi:uncharacterized Fe-S cluster-containing radical SAM superfamily protein
VFTLLKELMMTPLVLSLLDLDKLFIVETNASMVVWGQSLYKKVTLSHTSINL